MKRFVVFLALACLLFSGFGGGLWADEQLPPPDPGLGGGSFDDDEPGGDDHPWGGEDRAPGTTDTYDFETTIDRQEVETITVYTGVPTVDIWYGIFRQVIEPQVLSSWFEEKPCVRESRRYRVLLYGTLSYREGQ